MNVRRFGWRCSHTAQRLISKQILIGFCVDSSVLSLCLSHSLSVSVSMSSWTRLSSKVGHIRASKPLGGLASIMICTWKSSESLENSIRYKKYPLNSRLSHSLCLSYSLSVLVSVSVSGSINTPLSVHVGREVVQ